MSLEDDAAKFGRHFEGGWQLGLLVARNVHKQSGAGRPPKSEPVRNKVSCAKFAELANVSERTVQLYCNAWELAAHEGHCTPADQLMPGDDDPLLPDTTTTEHREMWRKFYREARGSIHHNGGDRGVTPYDRLSRARTAIGKITGLKPEAAEKQSEICRLIDELLTNIQPTAVSN